MNTIYNLYFSLGLLFSIEPSVYSNNEENSSCQTLTSQTEQTSIDACQETIDAELHELFETFFDQSDKTPFSKMVAKIIAILKIKKASLQPAQQIKCEELIRSLEKNKYNYSFPDWAKILLAPELLDLMPQKTRNYIDTVPPFTKMSSLVYKLKNNR